MFIDPLKTKKSYNFKVLTICIKRQNLVTPPPITHQAVLAVFYQ